MLIEIARKNQPWILQNELESGVPLIFFDENGQYVLLYRDGTILPASLEISFEENLQNHRRILEERRARTEQFSLFDCKPAGAPPEA